MLGIARTGGIAGHTSGDLLLAFSNAPEVRVPRGKDHVFIDARFLHDAHIDPVFEGVIEATEEAILNAMVAAETMTGRDGHVLHALPHGWIR
jgi:D-aminopeptidase